MLKPATKKTILFMVVIVTIIVLAIALFSLVDGGTFLSRMKKSSSEFPWGQDKSRDSTVFLSKEHCTDFGYQRSGVFKPETSEDVNMYYYSDGQLKAAQNNWLELCSPTGNEAKLIKYSDNCDNTGATNECPAGYTNAGSFKPDQVPCDGEPSGVDHNGAEVRDGTMGICVRDDLGGLVVASDLDNPTECFDGCPTGYMMTSLFRPSLSGGISGTDYAGNQIINGWLRMCSKVSDSPGGVSCCDGIQNEAEAGVDCGGPCPRCAAVGTSNRPSQVNPSVGVVSGDVTVELVASYEFGSAGVQERKITDLDYINGKFLLITDNLPAEWEGGYIYTIDPSSPTEREFIRNAGDRTNGLTPATCNNEICAFASIDPLGNLQPFDHWIWPFGDGIHSYSQGQYHEHMTHPILLNEYVVAAGSTDGGSSVLLVDNYQNVNEDGSLNVIFNPDGIIKGVFTLNNELYVYGKESNAGQSYCAVRKVGIEDDQGHLEINKDEDIVLDQYEAGGKWFCYLPGEENIVEPRFEPRLTAEKNGSLYFMANGGKMYRTSDFQNFERITYFDDYRTWTSPADQFSYSRLKGIYNYDGVLYTVSVNSRVYAIGGPENKEFAEKISVHYSRDGINWHPYVIFTTDAYNQDDGVVGLEESIYRTLLTGIPLVKQRGTDNLFIAIPEITGESSGGLLIHSTNLYRFQAP